MIEDLVSLKAASVVRGVSRAREEFLRATDTVNVTVATAYFRQKTTPVSIGCASEATLNVRQHPIHGGRLHGLQIAITLLLIVPTLLRLNAERPALRLPCWSEAAIKCLMPSVMKTLRKP